MTLHHYSNSSEPQFRYDVTDTDCMMTLMT